MQFSKRPKLLKPICGNDCNYFLRWMSSQKRLWWRVLADQPEAFHYHYVLFKARACHDNQNWQLMTFLCCTRICIYIYVYTYTSKIQRCAWSACHVLSARLCFFPLSAGLSDFVPFMKWDTPSQRVGGCGIILYLGFRKWSGVEQLKWTLNTSKMSYRFSKPNYHKLSLMVKSPSIWNCVSS